jgi:hypothetical protein
MPKIKVKCPHCNATINAPEEANGKIVSCPACAKKFQVRIFDELPTVKDDAPPEPSAAGEARPSHRRQDREDDPEEERPARRRRERDEDEDDRPRRRSRDEDEEDEDDRPRRRRGVRNGAESKTDTFGVISLIFGAISLVCLFLGCCTCGVTYYAAVPMAGVGAVLGFFGRANLRVAGLVLNFLALVPAIAFTVLFATGSGLASIDGLKGGSGEERSSLPPSSWAEVGDYEQLVREAAPGARIPNKKFTLDCELTQVGGVRMDPNLILVLMTAGVTVHGPRVTSVQTAEAMAGRAAPDKYGSMEGSDWTARRQVAALTERKQEAKRPNPPGWLFVPVWLFSHFFWPLPHSALAGFSRRGDQPNTNHSKGRLS